MSGEQGFDPEKRYLFLEDGGGVLGIDDPAALWRELEGEAAMSETARRVAEEGGWLFSAYDLTEDMRHWEMHPEGNEVLFMASGAMDLVLDEPAGDRSIHVDSGQACVVPQGVWHRQVVRQPGRLLAMTFGRGTQHKAR